MASMYPSGAYSVSPQSLYGYRQTPTSSPPAASSRNFPSDEIRGHAVLRSAPTIPEYLPTTTSADGGGNGGGPYFYTPVVPSARGGLGYSPVGLGEVGGGGMPTVVSGLPVSSSGLAPPRCPQFLHPPGILALPAPECSQPAPSSPRQHHLVGTPNPLLHLPHPSDMPSFKSLQGGIVGGIWAMTCVSLFICLGRTDFNLVFYLLGYYLWCIEGDGSDYIGLHMLMRSAQQYTMALCVACLVDVMWLFMGFSTWLCEDNEPAGACFSAAQDAKLRWTYGIHSFVLPLSLVNFFLKVAVIVMSFTWVQRQRKPPSSLRSPTNFESTTRSGVSVGSP